MRYKSFSASQDNKNNETLFSFSTKFLASAAVTLLSTYSVNNTLRHEQGAPLSESPDATQAFKKQNAFKFPKLKKQDNGMCQRE